MAAPNSLTRDQYLDSLRQLSAAADSLAERFSMKQLTWQPPIPGKDGTETGWSMLECLDHIAVATQVYLDAMEPAIGNANRAGAPAGVFRAAGAPSAWFIGTLEPPPSKKVPAPGKIRPRPTLNPEGVLPQFQKAIDRVAMLVNSTAGKDLNAVRFRNPLVPLVRFTVSSGFVIIAAHARRHLWQAEQVAKHSGFPVN